MFSKQHSPTLERTNPVSHTQSSMDTATFPVIAGFELAGHSMIFKQPPLLSPKYPGAQIHWFLEEERDGLTALPAQA